MQKCRRQCFKPDVSTYNSLVTTSINRRLGRFSVGGILIGYSLHTMSARGLYTIARLSQTKPFVECQIYRLARCCSVDKEDLAFLFQESQNMYTSNDTASRTEAVGAQRCRRRVCYFLCEGRCGGSWPPNYLPLSLESRRRVRGH